MIDEPEDTATVTDSPAANRRESRASGTFNTDAESSDPLINRRTRSTTTPSTAHPQLSSSSSWIDPHIAGPALETRSASLAGMHEALAVEKQSVERQQLNQLALFTEDVALMRTFSQLVGILCLTMVIILPFMEGNAILRMVLWGGCFFSIFTSIWVVFALKDLTRYDQNLINVMALLSVLIVYAGVLYLGVHSPAPLLILSGLYFVARSQTRGIALAMYLVCASLQGAISALIMTDTIVDPGLLRAQETDIHVRYIIQLLIQMSYLGTFILARTSRMGTLLAMDKVTEAERRAQQREAAFIEVRADLDRALAAGGLGHYSSHQLGQYQLGGIIGRGAMGEVYEAIHVQTGQRTAAKVLHPHVLAKKSSIERFLREAKAASSLRSPHSVQILDVSDSTAPIPYLIMERLAGYDLAHHLREVGRLGLGDVITLCEQIGTVIDLAAESGIVHRDLKPQNLFLAESTTGSIWKLLDFGASKLAEHSGTLTQGRVIGTPAYMSPQQARGQDVDGAADRYCLAAIAYRSLTGRAPYSGKDLPTTLFNVVYGTPPKPSVLADLDPSIDLVLAIGLAKVPEMRFASGVEFAQALKAAHDGSLSAEIRHRGELILAKHPWGMSPEKSS